MDNKKHNLNYLDGLRGWAALVILIHHYVLIFFTRYLDLPVSVDKQIVSMPLRLFIAGKFMICIFFTLSGFVIVYKYFLLKDIRIIISSATRRYFRLILPIGVSVLISYIFMKIDLLDNLRILFITNNLIDTFNFKPNILLILKNMFIIPYTNEYMNYNGVIFTVSYEIIASFVIYFIMGIFGKSKLRYIIYLLSILIIISFFDYYYLSFVLGLILCDLFIHQRTIFILSSKRLLTILLLIVAVYFGTYPLGSLIPPSQTIYAPLAPFVSDAQNIIFIIGAIIIIFVILTSKSLQSLFNTKLMQFFGKISFSLYILHYPFALAVSVSILNLLRNYFNYDFSKVLMIIISVILLFPYVYLFNRYIEIPIIIGIKSTFSYLENIIIRKYSKNKYAVLKK